MTNVKLLINCNDEDGDFDESITSIRLGNKEKIIFNGYPITVYDMKLPNSTYALQFIDLDEEDSCLRIPYTACQRRYKSNIWNQCEITISDAVRIIEYFRGIWTCDTYSAFVEMLICNNAVLAEQRLSEFLGLPMYTNPIIGHKYRHYKGTDVVVAEPPLDSATGLPVALDSYKEVPVVWYICDGNLWVRSLAEWNEEIDLGNGRKIPRFRLADET
jgi:Protein of unknown function (DUF1653)